MTDATSDPDASNGDAADAPSLRQRIASATGDRHAEAKALANRAGDEVAVEEAEIAVREAHGDIQPAADHGETESDLATASHAASVRDRKQS
jgi:hypothetical protein